MRQRPGDRRVDDRMFRTAIDLVAPRGALADAGAQKRVAFSAAKACGDGIDNFVCMHAGLPAPAARARTAQHARAGCVAPLQNR